MTTLDKNRTNQWGKKKVFVTHLIFSKENEIELGVSEVLITGNAQAGGALDRNIQSETNI